MKTTLRGRPRLDLELPTILEAVRRHRQVVAAARDLGCSDAYIHVRFKRVGVTLWQVLETSDLATLIHDEEQQEFGSSNRTRPLRQSVPCARHA